MINNKMRSYDYFTLTDVDSYGVPQLTEKQGSVKLSLTHLTTAITQDIKYKDSSYVGLTYDKNINDTYVIQYGDEKLKVLYVIPSDRLIQVFLGDYGNQI